MEGDDGDEWMGWPRGGYKEGVDNVREDYAGDAESGLDPTEDHLRQ